MVEKCQITVVVVVGDFGVITIQLWKLISFTQLGENIFGRSHSKKHKKIFQNLMNFVQFPSKMALQWSLKVQWKLCFSGVWPISFCWAKSFKEMEIETRGWSHLKGHLKLFSEIHKFGPVSSRNSATVISQSTVNIIFFRYLTHPTLEAHNFQTVGRK